MSTLQSSPQRLQFRNVDAEALVLTYACPWELVVLADREGDQRRAWALSMPIRFDSSNWYLPMKTVSIC